MKLPTRSTLVLAALLSLSTGALASKAEAVPAAKEGATERQQDKMKRCNADAARKELKGDERRAFMSTCLKG